MDKLFFDKSEIRSIIKESLSELIGFHGSRSDFNSFDLKYLGSGTGQQDYGYGIYVADSRDGAEHYGNIIYQVEIPTDKRKYIFAKKEYSPRALRSIKDKLYRYILKTTSDYKGAERELYQDLGYAFGEVMDGNGVYGTVSSYLGSDKETSEFFSKLGYVGIWIDDSNGFTNYVIFDAKNVKIIKKEKA